MRFILAAVVFISSVMNVSVALAQRPTQKVECLLEVAGKTYIDGECDWAAEPNGSFSLYAKDYFVMLFTDDGKEGEAFWNETPDATHAHSNLGLMQRRDACWSNDKASVCIWNIGERTAPAGTKIPTPDMVYEDRFACLYGEMDGERVSDADRLASCDHWGKMESQALDARYCWHQMRGEYVACDRTK